MNHLNRKAVVLKNIQSDIIEEAIIILKYDRIEQSGDIESEAKKIIANYISRKYYQHKKIKLMLKIGLPIAILSALAGIVSYLGYFG